MHKLTFLPFWTTRLAHSLSHLHLLLHSYIGVPSSTRNFPAKLYAILWALNDGQHVFSVFMPHLPSGHSHPIGGSSGMIIPSQGCKKLSRSSKYNFNNIWMKFFEPFQFKIPSPCFILPCMNSYISCAAAGLLNRNRFLR